MMSLNRAVYLIDKRGFLLFYNEQAAELWKCHPPLRDPAMPSSGLLKWYHPDGTALNKDQQPTTLALHNKKSFHNSKFYIEGPDGLRRSVIVDIDLLYNGVGDLTCLIMLEEVQDSKREYLTGRMTAIVESSDDAIISKSLEGIITTWNKAAEKMFGYTAQEVIGQSVKLLIPQDKQHEADIILGKVKEGHRVDHFETQRVAKDGKIIPVSLTVSPIKNSLGEVVGVSKIARDVSERLKYEEQRAMLSSIVDSSDDAIISKTLEGIITTWNKAAEKLFGYTAQEVIGQSIRLLIPSEKQHEEDIILGKIRNGQKVDHFETQRVVKDGRIIPISLTVSPVRNSLGEIIGASKIARDITERLKYEEQRAMLSSIVESSDDVIISKSLEGIITTWNKAAEKLFGYRAKEVIGKSIRILIPEEKQYEEDVILGKIRRGQKVDHFDTQRIAKDGRIIPISLTVSPLKNSSGEIIGASKIARDISDRLESEEKKAMLSSIVESSDDAIISKSLEGIITTWNKAAEKMFGYTAEEAIGQSIKLLIPPDKHHEEDYILGKIRSGERVDHYETLRVTKEGKVLPISLTVSPIKNSNNEVIGASKIARDITQQEKVKWQLQKYNERLEQLDAEKDKFIGIAGHELKTPLTVIKANLQLMEHQMEEEQPFISNALRHVEKLTLLVSDLLDISKIQANKLDLNLEQFNMEQLLQETIDNLQFTEPTHKFSLKSSLGNLKVEADRHRIEQVIINLATNAVKYSPNANEIIIHAQLKNDRVEIGVQDFGIGVPKDQQKMIFSSFFRIEGFPASLPGLGMGLYICKQIVKRHSGRMWLRSDVNKGSIFYFRIPVLQPQS